MLGVADRPEWFFNKLINSGEEMNVLIKQILIICLIIGSAFATTNNYICAELSMNDDGSWNVERPNVSDADVTNLTL